MKLICLVSFLMIASSISAQQYEWRGQEVLQDQEVCPDHFSMISRLESHDHMDLVSLRSTDKFMLDSAYTYIHNDDEELFVVGKNFYYMDYPGKKNNIISSRRSEESESFVWQNTFYQHLWNSDFEFKGWSNYPWDSTNYDFKDTLPNVITSYEYNVNGELTSESTFSKEQIINGGGPVTLTTYSRNQYGSVDTFTRSRTHNNAGNLYVYIQYHYTYDSEGILQYSTRSGRDEPSTPLAVFDSIRYHYNELDQLIKEDIYNLTTSTAYPWYINEYDYFDEGKLRRKWRLRYFSGTDDYGMVENEFYRYTTNGSLSHVSRVSANVVNPNPQSITSESVYTYDDEVLREQVVFGSRIKPNNNLTGWGPYHDHNHMFLSEYHYKVEDGEITDEISKNEVFYSPFEPTSTADNPISPLTVTLSPNPFSDRLFIQSETPGKGLLEIYDTAGQIVFMSLLESKTWIRLDHLPIGVYVYHWKQDGKTNVGKIVKGE